MPAACIIGWPAGHSRSPIIHNHWLKLHGLAGEYRKEAVAPDGLAAFLAGLADHGYVGANVTIPHKEAALALSQPDARAVAVGAANTLWRDGETLRSTNTDVEGFLANLDAAAPGWDAPRGNTAKTAIVVGAGGAARAVVFGLKERRIAYVVVINRTRDRASALAQRLGQGVEAAPWEALPSLLPGADLLVNTTSLGMPGQPSLEIDVGLLPKAAVVNDLVYVPLETPLLAAARTRGLRTADGLGMLLHQAVRGFSLWFGVTPAVTPELRALVAADLAGS